MTATTEEKVIYRLLRDPTDIAAKAKLDEWVAAGRIKLEDVRLGSSNPFDRLHRAEAFSESLRQAERERERATATLRKAEKTLAEARAIKSRNVFRPNDRMLAWRYCVTLALETDLIRHDDAGAKIAWHHRRSAIEWFTSYLWQWREVTPALLREITLRFVRGTPNLDDLMEPARSTRAGPTQQDWKAVRDRLQAG